MAMSFAGLDAVYFIPAATSPFKLGRMHATNEQRLDMLRLATAGEPRFSVSDVETLKLGISYTVDTVRHFTSVMPEAKLFFILGADSLVTLHQWKDAVSLVGNCEFITLARSGWDVAQLEGFDAQTRARLAAGVVRDFNFEVSSTEIRRRLASGESISELVNPDVFTYIQSHCLYGVVQEPQI